MVAGVSLFLCRRRQRGAGGFSASARCSASTIFGAASTPDAAAGVIISAPASSPSVGLRRGPMTGYKCAGSPNKYTPPNLFAIRDRISACNRQSVAMHDSGILTLQSADQSVRHIIKKLE